MPIVVVGTQALAYEVERSARRKRLMLTVTFDKRLIAKAPIDMPETVIETLIREHAAWILRHMVDKPSPCDPESQRRIEDEQGGLEYRIVRRKNRRRVSIYVRPGGGVEVRAPLQTPVKEIERFVRTNLSWIRDRQAQLLRHPAATRTWQSGDTLLVEGKLLRLEVLESRTRVPRVVSQDGVLQVTVPMTGDPAQRPDLVRAAVRRWLMQLAVQRTNERLPTLAAAVGVRPRQVRVKDMTSRWGSCTGTDRISLTYRIVMAPPQVMDYVLIHELCHLIHRNHSKDFWALVAAHSPHYRQHRAWLRRHQCDLEL